MQSTEFVTIKLPPGHPDSLSQRALQLTNDQISLEPALEPRRLTGDVFEFKLNSAYSDSETFAELRGQGLLVNPVIENSNGTRFRYSDRIIVEFRTGVNRDRKSVIHGALGCAESVPDQRTTDIVTVANARGRSVLDICNEYVGVHECIRAVPETFVTPVFHTWDSAQDYRALQWPFDNRSQSSGTIGADIDAVEAWEATTGVEAVKIAVLDCSICPHPDTSEPESRLHFYDAHWGLSSDNWGDEVACYVNPYGIDSLIGSAHGGSVLGVLAAAHNSFGTDGIAPGCSFYGVRVCPGVSMAKDDISNVDYAKGLAYVGDSVDAKIVVQSWDIPDPCRDCPKFANEDSIFYDALSELDRLRKIHHAAVFVAGGNSGGLLYDRVLVGSSDTLAFTIGATNHSDSHWSWSNHGPQLDFVAPAGVPGSDAQCRSLGDEPVWDPDSIWGLSPTCDKNPSKCRDQQDEVHNCGAGGTSFSAPKAAGVAALVLSRRPDFFDSADVGMALYNVLKITSEDKGDSGFDTLYGWGRVNAARAIAQVSRGDVMPNGVVDARDVVEEVNIVCRNKSCANVHIATADLNCDGSLSIVDVVMVVGIAFRKQPLADSCTTLPVFSGSCCPAPIPIEPDGDTVVYTAALTWTKEYWARRYKVQVDETYNFLSPVASDSVFDATYNVSGLTEGTYYYWRVSAAGYDCVERYSAARRFRYRTGSEPQSLAYEDNSVLVESKQVACGDSAIAVGIYVTNDFPLGALVLPLEIRSVEGTAFVSSPVALTTNGRLDTSLVSFVTIGYFPDKDAQTGTCDGYATPADSLDYVSPDGILYAGISNGDSLLWPGSDGEPTDGTPSLILTFNVEDANGTFEIDTTCTYPGNHLLFVDGSVIENMEAVTPQFTKGIITVGTATLSGHITGADTLSCDVALLGDVTVDSNASLTVISGGALLASAFDDVTNSGRDNNLVEIIVYGELVVGDGAGAPAFIGSDSAVAGAWYGIRVMPGGRLNVGSGAAIEDAEIGITVDSLADVDSLTRLDISNCDVAGILTQRSAVVIANNAISDIPGGYGIAVWDSDPLVIENRITNCETGIDALRSSAVVRDNTICGPGMHGILVSGGDEMNPGRDTLKIVADSILGYFSAAHLYAGWLGHCRVDSCTFVSQYVVGGQSPLGVSVGLDAWLKLRHTRIEAFGNKGVSSYKSKANLGKTKPNNGGVEDLGYNDIHTDSAVGCEEYCITRCVYHTGSTLTDTLRAEGNWWDSVPPPSGWFSALVDRTPYLDAPPLGKRAIEMPVVSSVPKSTDLGQNYPNPFNQSTTVSFSIKSRAQVRLIVYNTLGQQVTVLADREYEPGDYRVIWDGRNQDGAEIASGVYLYRLTAGDFSESKKMVLLR